MIGGGLADFFFDWRMSNGVNSQIAYWQMTNSPRGKFKAAGLIWNNGLNAPGQK